MRRMMYYIRVCKAYLRIGFVTLIQYPADTVIWILSMLLREASGFIGIITIASVAGGLGNWGIYEICILFSICAIIEAIGQAFLDCVWSISSAIRKFYNRPLGKTPIQEVYSGTHYYGNDGTPVVITNNHVTVEARLYANKLGVEIISDTEWVEFKRLMYGELTYTPQGTGLFGIMLWQVSNGNGKGVPEKETLYEHGKGIFHHVPAGVRSEAGGR